MNRSTQQPPHSNPSDSFLIPGDSPGVNSPEHGEMVHIPGDSSPELNHRFVLSLEGELIREFSLEDNNLTIGRKYGNDIQLNDIALSGCHALISTSLDYVFIEDLGSMNGTLVNGCHVKKVAINHGDIIQVGNYQLTYLCEDNTQNDPTMFIKAEHDETQIIYTDSGDQTNIKKGLALGGLRTVDEIHSKPVMELRKKYNTIGFRGKRMALITRGSEGYSISAITGIHNRRISDMPSLNGKKINEKQHSLRTGDKITIAGYEVQFYFLG